MRILLVSNHGADRTYGGAERYVSDLEAALRDRGHEVALLSAFPIRDESATRTTTLHATDWRTDPIRRVRNHVDDWRAAPSSRLREIVSELDPDVVHTNNLVGIASGIWEQARRLGIPVAHTLHDYQLLCPRTTLMRPDGRPCRPHALLCGQRARRLGRWAGAVAAVIGVSSHVLGRHQGFFPAATYRTVIHPPRLRDPATHPPKALRTVGYLGVLRDFKGVGRLLEAAPRLAELGLCIRIAGHGPMEDAVRRAPDVEFAGHLHGAEVSAFLASCDLGVVPSLWEEPGLGYAACEWLGADRPVLLSRRGGLAETAALRGTASFDGTADGLVQALTQLRAVAAWETLIQRLVREPPAPSAEHPLAQWTDRHLEAYAAAGSRR